MYVQKLILIYTSNGNAKSMQLFNIWYQFNYSNNETVGQNLENLKIIILYVS